MDDNDLNPQPELSADELAAEAAFAEGFGDDTGENLPSTVEPGDADQTPKTDAPAALEAEVAPDTPAEAADPFAGLPEPVKKALQSIPVLEETVRRTNGQVRALQSAHDRAAAEAAKAAASVEAPRSDSYEQVAKTLPEVVETIEEIVSARLKAVAPPVQQEEAPADTRLPDEIRLDEGFPEWRTIAAGNDFKTWAATQPDARVIQSTQDMVTFMGAITRFKAHEAAQAAVAQEARRQAALRNQRIGASVTPTRGGPRRPSTSQTEEEAFAAGFNGE